MDYKIEEEIPLPHLDKIVLTDLIYINQESLIVFIDWNLEQEGIDFIKKGSYFTYLNSLS